MFNGLENLKLPGSDTYTISVNRIDCNPKEFNEQLEFNFEIET
ncbi:hypothetical protein [Bacillus sp. E214]|nr:hypothetical protein [Bacillus sp. E214]